MKRTSLLFLLVGLLLSSAAQARHFGHFGHSENEYIEKIQDLNIPPQVFDGDTVFLAHLVNIHSLFFGGIYLDDEGYVLGSTNDPEAYYPLEAKTITTLQDNQLLPATMPSYSISMQDYFRGYSFWVVFAGLIIFQRWYRKRKLQKSSR